MKQFIKLKRPNEHIDTARMKKTKVTAESLKKPEVTA